MSLRPSGLASTYSTYLPYLFSVEFLLRPRRICDIYDLFAPFINRLTYLLTYYSLVRLITVWNWPLAAKLTTLTLFTRASAVFTAAKCLSVRPSVRLSQSDVVSKWLNPLRPLLPYGYSYNHPVPERVKPSFVIFDIRALWHSAVKNYKWRLNPVRHRMHFSYTYNGNSGRQKG